MSSSLVLHDWKNGQVVKADAGVKCQATVWLPWAHSLIHYSVIKEALIGWWWSAPPSCFTLWTSAGDDVHCLWVGWLWLHPSPASRPPSCCRRVQRLTDLVRGVSGGLDWETEDPVSVLCKVQSCVTHWHTRVCLEYRRVLCGVPEKINNEKPAVCKKN